MLLHLWDIFTVMDSRAWELFSGWSCSSWHALVVNGGSGSIRLMLGSPSRPYGVYNLNRSHRLKGRGRSGECHEVMSPVTRQAGGRVGTGAPFLCSLGSAEKPCCKIPAVAATLPDGMPSPLSSAAELWPQRTRFIMCLCGFALWKHNGPFINSGLAKHVSWWFLVGLFSINVWLVTFFW